MLLQVCNDVPINLSYVTSKKKSEIISTSGVGSDRFTKILVLTKLVMKFCLIRLSYFETFDKHGFFLLCSSK